MFPVVITVGLPAPGAALTKAAPKFSPVNDHCRAVPAGLAVAVAALVVAALPSAANTEGMSRTLETETPAGHTEPAAGAATKAGPP